MFVPLIFGNFQVLRERQWLTARLDQELRDGARFWGLERKSLGCC